MPERLPPRLPADGFNALADCRHGPMLYNRHDRYVGASLRKYGEFSKGETDLFRQVVSPNVVVVEIGANIGAHTVALSRMVQPNGMVIAFEPQRIAFQTLCGNLALNSCANVHAIQAAIGAAPGEIIVPLLPPDQPNNFGGLGLGTWTEGERVAVRTIDSFRLPSCHFVKIDVEGMEVEALKGSAATIAAHRPFLYVENDRADRSQELIALLLSFGYRLYQHTPPLFSADNYAGEQENIFGPIVSINLFCLPAEREATLRGFTEVTAG